MSKCPDVVVLRREAIERITGAPFNAGMHVLTPDADPERIVNQVAEGLCAMATMDSTYPIASLWVDQADMCTDFDYDEFCRRLLRAKIVLVQLDYDNLPGMPVSYQAAFWPEDANTATRQEAKLQRRIIKNLLAMRKPNFLRMQAS